MRSRNLIVFGCEVPEEIRNSLQFTSSRKIMLAGAHFAFLLTLPGFFQQCANLILRTAHELIFARVLPRLVLRGFMARDDAGGLFSPHLYDRLLRKEERAARKAQAEADRAQWVAEAQERGDAPQGMTPKQIASILNGRKGGRPRKNPAPAAGQKNMPFYGVVGGTEKPEQKNNTSQVMENEPWVL